MIGKRMCNQLVSGTFLIGPDGRVRRIWDAVKPDAHAAEVLAALADGG
jgi:peroxiredoxin